MKKILFAAAIIASLLAVEANAQDGFSGLGLEDGKLIKTIGHNEFIIRGEDGPIMRFLKLPGNDNSKVHIGSNEVTPPSSDYNLYVEDGILSESVKVANPQTWSDFVFQEDYELRDLEEVEQHIEEYQHLPDVPSERELIEQGYYDQHEMNKLLLQKIEELTLYIIDQQKAIESLNKE